jgi:hypothetical protein
LLASSPTYHSAAVIELLEKWRPDIVIFDNAGRTAQLRAARASGARVIYISARRRQRRKAFRLSWMRLLDEHWIAYPQFIAGPPGFFERLKLKMAGRPIVRYLDVIMSPADPAQRGAVLARAGCPAGDFVLVVPGGGTGHPGADEAADRFIAAARALAASGAATVYVGPIPGHTLADASAQGGPDASAHGGPDASAHGEPDASGRSRAIDPARDPNWHRLGPLPQAELAQLMRSSRLIVANGGSTLLQAIACGRACIAVPIARDQFERTRLCVAAGVAVAATLDEASIIGAARRLMGDEPQRAALAGRAAGLELADGVEVAVRALGDLLESAQRTAPL